MAAHLIMARLVNADGTQTIEMRESGTVNIVFCYTIIQETDSWVWPWADFAEEFNYVVWSDATGNLLAGDYILALEEREEDWHRNHWIG